MKRKKGKLNLTYYFLKSHICYLWSSINILLDMKLQVGENDEYRLFTPLYYLFYGFRENIQLLSSRSFSASFSFSPLIIKTQTQAVISFELYLYFAGDSKFLWWNRSLSKKTKNQKKKHTKTEFVFFVFCCWDFYAKCWSFVNIFKAKNRERREIFTAFKKQYQNSVIVKITQYVRKCLHFSLKEFSYL